METKLKANNEFHPQIIPQIVSPAMSFAATSSDNTTPTPTPVPTPAPSRQKVPQPPVITEIIPGRLWVSNVEGAMQTERLAQMGITHVLSALRNMSQLNFPPSIHWMQFRLVDCAQDLTKLWDPPLKFLADAASANGRVLVHCTAGMSRSITLVLAHLMQCWRMHLLDAWILVKTRHPLASPIIPFFQLLINFEQTLYGSTSITIEQYQFQALQWLFPSLPHNQLEQMVAQLQGDFLAACRTLYQTHPEAFYQDGRPHSLFHPF
ncbi:putative dual specificity MAP kinase phosphatase [Paratrimastix pyriformis]|uniref:protein-tyrosine-phosphatase n=1 Tax=Paratrimastix pyriformis TaxID=342808 RepID=A0ABQ8UM86_9EUKA|nr:putative dual specificity MAP kinase phosphatase [Paratrimastix pyriformis]